MPEVTNSQSKTSCSFVYRECASNVSEPRWCELPGSVNCPASGTECFHPSGNAYNYRLAASGYQATYIEDGKECTMEGKGGLGTVQYEVPNHDGDDIAHTSTENDHYLFRAHIFTSEFGWKQSSMAEASQVEIPSQPGASLKGVKGGG
jgi:hypothetical protein